MLSENIKKYRKLRGLSQEQLAEALNVTRQSVSKWETGIAQPDADNLVLLASVLGTTVESLSADESQPSGNDKISEMLFYGEEIIWSGQPDINKKFTKFDRILLPFGVMWFSFAIFWTVTATAIGGPFGLFGIPFLVIGYYFCIGRFKYKKKNKMHTYYAITDRRIIVYNDFNRVQINDMPISRAYHLSFDEDKDGIGNIYFSEIASQSFLGFKSALYANSGLDRFMSLPFPSAFYDINNVRQVYGLLKSVNGNSEIE